MKYLLHAYLSIQALSYGALLGEEIDLPRFKSDVSQIPPLPQLLFSLINCFIAPKVCPNPYVTFYLYTSSNPTKPIKLGSGDPKAIRNAKIKRPVKILIHGFNRNHDQTPNNQIRPVYLRTIPGVTIISVDYAPLCKAPCYIESVENSALVAMCIAQFIEQLLKLKPNIKLSDIHIIGHSLGAEVAGQISTYLKLNEQIGRITSLDAAGPLFYNIGPVQFHDQINKGDAKRVEAIHTNGGVLGKLLPYADIDFFVNGGTYQPGCVFIDILCSHERSADYFAESIESTVGFRAHKCQYPPPITLGQCVPAGGPTVLFGEYVDPNATGIYYLRTAALPPYALPENN